MGSYTQTKKRVLFIIAEELGISKVQFEQFLDMIQSGRQFGQRTLSSNQEGIISNRMAQPLKMLACKVLTMSPE